MCNIVKQLIRDIRSKEIRTIEKAILEYINDRTGKNENCWPGYDLLSEELGMHRVTAIDVITKLTKLGLIKKIKGLKKSNSYQIVKEKIIELVQLTNPSALAVDKPVYQEKVGSSQATGGGSPTLPLGVVSGYPNHHHNHSSLKDHNDYEIKNCGQDVFAVQELARVGFDDYSNMAYMRKFGAQTVLSKISDLKGLIREKKITANNFGGYLRKMLNDLDPAWAAMHNKKYSNKPRS
jgi:hypothetical protein